MPWVKLDDRLTEHPKVLAAGPLAIAMQVAGLCYCNRELTDGFIPRAKARSLLDWEFVRKDGRVYTISVGSGMQGIDVDCQWVIDLLVEVGIWEYADGGYQIHDFSDYQPSREQVESERQATAKRQANWRSRHKGSNGLDNGGSNDESNAVTNGPVTSAPVPVPVPHVLSQSEDCSERGKAPLPPVLSDPKGLPENGEAQKIVAAYCRAAQIEKPADYGRSVSTAGKMVKAGIMATDIPAFFGFVASWSDGPDLGIMFGSIDKWRASQHLGPKIRAGPKARGMNGAEIMDYVDGVEREQTRDGQTVVDAASRVVERKHHPGDDRGLVLDSG